MKVISKEELNTWISKSEKFTLIDVREDYEFEEQNIGGKNIPLADIMDAHDSLPTDQPVVFCCKSGKRSGAMVSTLERKFGLKNLYSLEGGLSAYFATENA